MASVQACELAILVGVDAVTVCNAHLEGPASRLSSPFTELYTVHTAYTSYSTVHTPVAGGLSVALYRRGARWSWSLSLEGMIWNSGCSSAIQLQNGRGM